MRSSEKRRARTRTARLESCEPRELLSAVPAYDFWVEDQHRPETGLYADLNPAATAAHSLTGLDQARATYGFTGSGQTVAVIDTGIAYTHAALGGGYGSGYRVVGGWDFTKNVADAFDAGPYGSHGTHVAGIIGSSDSTYTGVAPDVDLVGLRVFDDNGGGYFSWVEQALWWVHENRFAFENPITTVNLSLGANFNGDSLPSWAMLEGALAQLKADGIFISVAAGNSYTQYETPGLSYPAVSSHVVAVGSVDANGALSSFSQRHSRMIAAPGRSIMSTVPDYVGNYNGIHDDFAAYSGTSMAAPYVAGASALLREAYAFAGSQSVNQAALYNLMYSTADTFYDTPTQQSYQRLNLQAAIDAVMPADDYGSSVHTAHAMGTLTETLGTTGHISRLNDVDWFQFTAGSTGSVTITATSTLNLAPKWNADGFTVATGNDGNSITFNVAAGRTYRFALSTADGLGHYTLHAGLNAAAGSEALLDVQFADVNGNGLADIVGRSADDGTWWVAVNQGNGNFANQHWGRWSSRVAWNDVVVGDFNGDGYADIAGRVGTNGDWWIAKSNGTSGFTNERWGRWSPNVAWNDVVVGDFNGDGRDDIIGRVGSNGDWWVAKSFGGSRFANERWGRWSANVDWNNVVAGDFNGDGRDDIAGRVGTNGDWWVAKSNGGNRFANERWGRWSANVAWNDVVVGDFNGDGRADIAGRVGTNGDWWVAKSYGGNRFANQRWGRWSPNVAWTEVMAGDFTGNGRTDIAGRVGTNGDWWIAKSNGVSAFANERWGHTSAPIGWEHVVVGNYTPTAAPLHTAAAAAGGQSLPASVATTALSPAQCEAFVCLTDSVTSAHSLGFRQTGASPEAQGSGGLERSVEAAFAGFGNREFSGRMDRWVASPGDEAIERLDLVAAVLSELDGLAGATPGRQGSLASTPASHGEWEAFSAADPWHECPAWEAFLDDSSPDATSLDAFYATLA